MCSTICQLSQDVPPGRPGKPHLNEAWLPPSPAGWSPGSAAHPRLPCPAARGGFSPRVCDLEPGRRRCGARAWPVCAFQGVPSPDISGDEPSRAGSGQWPLRGETPVSAPQPWLAPRPTHLRVLDHSFTALRKLSREGRGQDTEAQPDGQGQQEGRAGLRKAV